MGTGAKATVSPTLCRSPWLVLTGGWGTGGSSGTAGRDYTKTWCMPRDQHGCEISNSTQYVNKVKWTHTFYRNSSFVSLTKATGYYIQCNTPLSFGTGVSWSMLLDQLAKEVPAGGGGLAGGKNSISRLQYPQEPCQRSQHQLEARQQLLALLC